MHKVEQAIGMAHKMYECRKAAKLVFGDDYKQRVLPYRELIQGIMDRDNISEIRAILVITRDPKVKNSEMAIMMLMAAAIEISEVPTT